MIIDADTHISPATQRGNTITVDELLRRMDRAGVDRAISWLQPSHLAGYEEGNRYVFESARAHPDRILGFGWADPTVGVQQALDMVAKCVDEYGFYGVKLNGAQNSYYIDDPLLSLPVLDVIARAGTVLALHVGADAVEHTHPFRVAKIARLYPDLRILAVHMGGVAHHDLSDAMIEVARACPNITLVGSAVRFVNVLKAIEALGAQRVCFGSDTPFALMHVDLAAYRALLSDLSEDERQDVLWRNIARVLGLPTA